MSLRAERSNPDRSNNAHWIATSPSGPHNDGFVNKLPTSLIFAFIVIGMIISTEAFAQQTKIPLKGVKTETAIFAGGCFWGVEEIVRDFTGVIETDVGYTGGDFKNPTYQDVSKGTTGHAEAVRIRFNPAVAHYEDLLRYFFRLHDPTTLNSQGNDVGTQYRSAVFYTSEAQRLAAIKIFGEVEASGKWNKSIVTQLVSAKEFYPAEDYHQDYLQKNPRGYTCHFLRD